MIVKPGPVDDFLLASHKVDHPNKIDSGKVMTHWIGPVLLSLIVLPLSYLLLLCCPLILDHVRYLKGVFLIYFWFIWLLHAFFSSFSGFLLSFTFFQLVYFSQILWDSFLLFQGFRLLLMSMVLQVSGL